MSFNEKAKQWDKDPNRIALAKKASGAIKDFYTTNTIKKHNAMEYGCGTGLVSCELIDVFSEITAADNSEGMLEVLNDKISQKKIKNLHSVLLNLEEDKNFQSSFDVIYNSMVMHHVKNTGKILSRFYDCLNPEGFRIIIDLNQEDGSFHGDDFSGHHGFNTRLLIEQAEKIGFKPVEEKELTRFKKGEPEKEYSIFFLALQKS